MRNLTSLLFALAILGLPAALTAGPPPPPGLGYALHEQHGLAGFPEQVGVADFTGDGLDDLYCTTNFPAGISIFHNNGLGSLLPAPGIVLTDGVFGHAVGDFNGDAIPDLVLGQTGLFTSQLQIYLGVGDGTFLPPSANIGTSRTLGPLTVADLNGDGHLDVAVTYIDLATADDHGAQIFLGDGLGGLTPHVDVLTALPSFEVHARDLNGDAVPDLVITTQVFGIFITPGTAEVRLGLGGATFGPTQLIVDQVLLGPSCLAHLDGNAHHDLVLTVQTLSGEFEIRTYSGQANGTFTPAQTVPIFTTPGALVVTDIDVDGDPDLVFGQYDFMTGLSGMAYLANDGSGMFGALSPIGIFGDYSPYAPTALQLIAGGPPELALGTSSPGNALEIHAAPAVTADEFLRGDTNNDLAVNIADAIALLGALFVPGTPPLACASAGDANDDDFINIADAIRILDHLFVPGSLPLPAPFPSCGSDPTAGAITCATPPCP